MNIVKIEYRTAKAIKKYDIEIDKLIYVLSKLENDSKLKYQNQEQIEKLMKKYDLFNEYFLKNINKI